LPKHKLNNKTKDMKLSAVSMAGNISLVVGQMIYLQDKYFL
jgi:hypothetical protein